MTQLSGLQAARLRNPCTYCGGQGDIGPARSAEGDWLDQPCPKCLCSGCAGRSSGELTQEAKP